MFLITINADFTEIYGKWIYNEKNNHYWCQGFVPVWGGYASLFVDILLSLALMVMFLRPLLKLLKTQSVGAGEDGMLNC